MSEAILKTPKAVPQDLRQFYDKYAGMLLGFIQGTIQDPVKSEEHLIKIITSFVLETKPDTESGLSIWMHLRQHAQRKLVQNISTNKLQDNSLSRMSKHAVENLDLLTTQERTIFKAVYYHGKSISNLAEILGEEENYIRIQLKSSMDKMRRVRGN